MLAAAAILLFLPASDVFARVSPAQDHLQKAVALISQGDLAAAESEARKALSTPSTSAPAYSILGTIRLQQRRLEESRQFLEKAIALNTKLLGARLTLGQVYSLEGKTERALEVLQEVLRMAPNNPTARMTLAQLEASAGNYLRSRELVEPVREDLRGTPDGLLLLLVISLGSADKEEARGLVTDWLALNGHVPPPLTIEFAKPLVASQLAPEAVQVIEKGRRDDPASFELIFALGGAYLASGDSKRASGYYEQAATLNERCVLCFRQIARMAELEGETEKALSFLIKAKVLEPENPEVLFDFGRVCLERRLLRDALPALEKAVQLRPDDGRYAFALASAYNARQRFKESLEIFDRLIRKKPEDPVLNHAIGYVLYSEGQDLDGAEKYLRKSIRLMPQQLSGYHYLGMVLFKKGDEDQALQVFHELLQRYPDDLASLEQLSKILVKKRRYDEVRQVLDRVLRLDPNSHTGHYQMALLLGRLGQKEEAEKHMRIAEQSRAEDEKKARTELYLLNPQ